MTYAAEDEVFNIDGREVAAKLWQKPDAIQASIPLIALHGWCDNAASFDFLAPALNAQVLAIDLAGHGKSYHRGSGGSYTIWSDIYDIYAVAQAMGWQSFHLVGHSRGAMIATIFASVFPEKVQEILLIEGLLPPPEPIENISQQLRRSVNAKEKLSNLPKNHYDSYEAATKAREKGLFHISNKDAAALAKRGVLKQDKSSREGLDSYIWYYDPLLKCPSEVKLSMEHLRVIASEVRSPVTLVTGEQSGFEKYDALLNVFKELMTINHHIVPGRHHLHMSENAGRVASIFDAAIAKSKKSTEGESLQ